MQAPPEQHTRWQYARLAVDKIAIGESRGWLSWEKGQYHESRRHAIWEIARDIQREYAHLIPVDYDSERLTQPEVVAAMEKIFTKLTDLWDIAAVNGWEYVGVVHENQSMDVYLFRRSVEYPVQNSDKVADSRSNSP